MEEIVERNREIEAIVRGKHERVGFGWDQLELKLKQKEVPFERCWRGKQTPIESTRSVKESDEDEDKDKDKEEEDQETNLNLNDLLSFSWICNMNTF